MNSTIRSCFPGAEKSTGVVVFIDVFRSSNTILMLLTRGALSIIPIATVQEALALKNAHPSFVLVGERQGRTIDGFDMGNSPYEVTKSHVAGKHVILTTSAGTQALVQTENAEKMLIGGFGNAQVLIHWLCLCNPSLVTWLAVRTDGIRKAEEDEVCAFYLQEKLRCNAPPLWPLLGGIMESEGAYRLKRLGQENDFPYCLGVDLFEIVPEVIREEKTLRIKVATRVQGGLHGQIHAYPNQGRN